MKKKRNPHKTLKNKLDKLWSLAIRKMYKRCIVCGSPDNLQAHHCIVRKGQSLGVRWLLENGVALCYTCHIFKLHGNQGDKQFLDRYMEAVNQAVTSEAQEAIIEIGHRVNKMSVEDMEEIVESLTKYLEANV